QCVLVWNPAVDARLLRATGGLELRDGLLRVSTVQCRCSVGVQRESLATLRRPSEGSVGGMASGHDFPSGPRDPGIWADGGVAPARSGLVRDLRGFQAAAGRGCHRADRAEAASTLSLLDCVPGLGRTGPALAGADGSQDRQSTRLNS